MCVNTEEAQLYGQFNQKESGGIWITVARCNDDVSTVKCKSQDEIDKYVNTLTFEVLYADHYLDFDDYHAPLRAHIISDTLEGPTARTPVSILGAPEVREPLTSHHLTFPVSRFVGSNWPIQQWFYLWSMVA